MYHPGSRSGLRSIQPANALNLKCNPARDHVNLSLKLNFETFVSYYLELKSKNK